MKKIIVLAAIVGSLGISCTNKDAQEPEHAQKTVIVIFDGLRPDFVTDSLMPNLYRLKMEGTYAAHNHSVFPTVTRVNSSSFGSASYPKTHGILGNAIHIPGLNGEKTIYNTSHKADLDAIDSLSKGALLSTTTVGEVLAAAGKKLYVFSSGSTGQAYLQNPRVGGAVVHPEFILPQGLETEVHEQVGHPDSRKEERFGLHRWVTDAFLAIGLRKDEATINTLWYSEPDAVQHKYGIGAPAALEAIRFMDGELGRILKGIEESGMSEQINLIVTADHGFITYEGSHTLRDFLIEEGLKASIESTDVIVAEGAIFVADGDTAKIANIVQRLQHQDWIGPIFTKSSTENPDFGVIPGTLSFDLIHWSHPERSADILVTYHWTDERNTFHYAGVQKSKSGIAAGHGGISTYEIHTPLILHGPAFRKAHNSESPSSFIDILPTAMALHGVDRSPAMDGRVLSETMLNADAEPGLSHTVSRDTIRRQVLINGQEAYHIEVGTSSVNGFRYLNFGRVVR